MKGVIYGPTGEKKIGIAGVDPEPPKFSFGKLASGGIP